MKTNLAKRLKQALDNMSKEQVYDTWESVKKLNLTGPSLSDVIDCTDNNN